MNLTATDYAFLSSLIWWMMLPFFGGVIAGWLNLIFRH